MYCKSYFYIRGIVHKCCIPVLVHRPEHSLSGLAPSRLAMVLLATCLSSQTRSSLKLSFGLARPKMLMSCTYITHGASPLFLLLSFILFSLFLGHIPLILYVVTSEAFSAVSSHISWESKKENALMLWNDELWTLAQNKKKQHIPSRAEHCAGSISTVRHSYFRQHSQMLHATIGFPVSKSKIIFPPYGNKCR